MTDKRIIGYAHESLLDGHEWVQNRNTWGESSPCSRPWQVFCGGKLEERSCHDLQGGWMDVVICYIVACRILRYITLWYANKRRK